jgi:asparagine synthase (glutamine-hydrolysing)
VAREEEYLEELDARLREAVGLRLISDVPLGAFLSGGIDSSTVVAYMKEASGTPPVTIAVGFNDREFDEVEHAETVARHLGCDFHALVANPESKTCCRSWPGISMSRSPTRRPCPPTTCRRRRAGS